MTAIRLSVIKTDRPDRFVLRSNLPYTTTYAHLTEILPQLPEACRYFQLQASDGAGDWLDRHQLEATYSQAIAWGSTEN
jgi:hypothetical protein